MCVASRLARVLRVGAVGPYAWMHEFRTGCANGTVDDAKCGFFAHLCRRGKEPCLSTSSGGQDSKADGAKRERFFEKERGQTFTSFNFEERNSLRRFIVGDRQMGAMDGRGKCLIYIGSDNQALWQISITFTSLNGLNF